MKGTRRQPRPGRENPRADMCLWNVITRMVEKTAEQAGGLQTRSAERCETYRGPGIDRRLEQKPVMAAWLVDGAACSAVALSSSLGAKLLHINI